MAHHWPYSPRLYYDEPVHDPHYERYRHPRNPFAPPHSHLFSARSPLYHGEPLQPAEKTSSQLPVRLLPMAKVKDLKELTSEAMPTMSFRAAVEKLKTTNSIAYDFFKNFHKEFKEETKAINYASRKVLDALWEEKVRNAETKYCIKPAREQMRNQNQNQNWEQDQEHEAGRERTVSCERSFLELRDDLLCRCAAMQNARVPKWPHTTPEDHERKNSAEAFVKKVNASIRDMTPNLKLSERDASAMKAAVQEMESIGKFMETYCDAWEGEGVRRQEYYPVDEE